MKKIIVFLVVMFLFCSVQPLPAEGIGAHQMAEVLLKEIWDAMKAGDMNLLDRKVADGFQSVHRDGARDRDAELDLLSKLNMQSYTLSDIKATMDGGLLVVTYTVSAVETINGKQTSDQPSPRLDVFRELKPGFWQWVAHANLTEI